MSPIFWSKAIQVCDIQAHSTGPFCCQSGLMMFPRSSYQLRDIWLSLVNPETEDTAPAGTQPPPDPLTPPVDGGFDNGSRTTALLPNPFASFAPSKRLPLRSAGLSPPESPSFPQNRARKARVDVLAWLARATLDVIGEAGELLCSRSCVTPFESRCDPQELVIASTRSRPPRLVTRRRASSPWRSVSYSRVHANSV